MSVSSPHANVDGVNFESGGFLVDVQAVITSQKARFASGATRATTERQETLHQLRQAILDNVETLSDALSRDLGKPQMEILTSEIGYVLAEAKRSIARLPRWNRTKRVPTPLFLRPGRSLRRRVPYGSVLVIGPWNYPLHLSLVPAVAAIAAGNSVVLKPSEYAPAAAAALERIINNRFNPNTFHVVLGEADVARELAASPFDYIFFTGSTEVGRAVYRSAAERLIPVTLELGGKNPCVVDADVDVAVAAKRIAWGKYFNAGQTCVAPDTVLVQAGLKDALVAELEKAITTFYGTDPAASPNYGRIINDRHFERLVTMLGQADILHGGRTDSGTRYIEPTLASPHEPADSDHPASLVHDEIFGPILPIVAWTDRAELETLLSRFPTPLASYVFSSDSDLLSGIERRHRSGTLVIHDTFSQISNHELPFGGVGSSGFGSYHGEEGYRTFTRPMGVYHKSPRHGLSLAYPPYSKQSLSFMRRGLIR